MAAQLWASYKQWADVQETLFLDWADPSGQYKLSPLQDLPGADFATAFAICVVYISFVVIGTVWQQAIVWIKMVCTDPTCVNECAAAVCRS